ncbi:TonB-dependent receptor [Brevundimonas naejangsanensis]|uniref:TonB-dependent receptor n=1 Tax=Brevundimonas naejangsanensis TaxID=588932 RepID=A0A494RJ21_9CAUL|nr:TonB-dependent receptor [Brevundimonas naejangsanensis]AYG93916.1 TonB-dependent receptor [Brevundimonas naejangsanensis]
MLWLPLAAVMMVEQPQASSLAVAPGHADWQGSRQRLDDPVRVDDIEVRGRRGVALVPPETELDGADIDALGAWDIGEVLRRMNETLDLGEEPMVLINGKRAPNSAVFSGFPPDALARAEVLPPEAAALYGGAPGQRVVNLVLQKRFSSHDGRMSGARPTQGGTSSLSADLRRSAITGGRTHQLGLRVSRDTALRAEERERGLVDEGANDGAITLRPRVDAVSVNANMTRPLGDWSSVFSLNGQARDSRSVARFGERIVDSRGRSENLGASAGFSGRAAGWSLQANMNGQASRAREDGFADTRNERRSLGLTSSANRALFELPTGAVVVNLNGHLRGSWSTIHRDHVRASTDFHTGEARGSLAIPLSKAGEEGTGRLFGELLATVGGGVRESSAGSGDEVNAALAWTPRKGLRLNGVWSASSDSVPDLQRFEPLHHGTPTIVFDFRTGQAVEVVPIRGGNPDLRPPRSERVSLTAAAGPFTPWGVTGNLGYQRMASTDGIGALPDLTEDVEAALPDRFQRDADGRLISIDYRPINSRSSLSETLSTSLNFKLPRPAGVAANEAMVLRVALSHSLRLRNTVALLEGRPDLDRLRGDGGGVSRQEARGTLDARRGRWGVNASARWQDSYRTRRVSGRDDPRDLVMEPFTAVDVKLSYLVIPSSARPGQDGEDGPPSRRGGGLQLSLEIDNLFDARPGARLGDGSPAPGFGRDLQDPIGRTARLTLQRRF